ncbi:MAG: polyprenyl synthetase family protein [Rubellimicrobium sp.]|nr:polyprenyl synthetase family protein [Rubellimicrobium sp.]
MASLPGRCRLTLTDSMAATGARIEALVARHLDGAGNPVAGAMRYALAGGKCLRGFLVVESAALHGIGADAALPAAAAIECIHAYSLVHDDLPAMDDDHLRRGRPTVHRAWDEATAILAGDALQALAFELLAGADTPNALRLIATLARGAGVRGMVGGQAMDIAAEGAEVPLTLDEITRLQAGKTGALITWAAAAGARMAGADDRALVAYGDALGLAFQIADDLLDVEGDAAAAGKALRKDAAAGKATFVSLLGPAGARARAQALADAARLALLPYGNITDKLSELARFAITRKN